VFPQFRNLSCCRLSPSGLGCVKTRRWECDRPGVEPTSCRYIVWGQYHSSEKVSCDEWYWNPSPDISGYICVERGASYAACCSQQGEPWAGSSNSDSRKWVHLSPRICTYPYHSKLKLETVCGSFSYRKPQAKLETVCGSFSLGNPQVCV